MNFKAVIYILGWILNIEGAFMFAPVLISLIYGETQGAAFAVVALICIATGSVIVSAKPENMTFFTKEGLAVTALAWIILSLFGCLPFIINRDIPSFTDALFETVSGFTTTGTSILNDVEALSHASLFWRSFTHWIGGMGVLVFLLALIPMTGGSHMNIMRAESPGPVVGKFLPKVRQTAFALYAIYIALTVAEILALIICRMPVFDAVNTALATAGTGGFGIKSTSLADYSPCIQWIVAVFMALFGINFNVYFLLFMRRFKSAALHEEARYYLLIILAAAAVITLSLYVSGTLPEKSFGGNIRHVFFQVISVITTTGFTTLDYEVWPQIALTILIGLMFIGACAGSTGGGIKVSRILILFRTVCREIMLFFNPKRVVKIKIEDKPVTNELVHSVSVFLAAYVLLFAVSVLLVSIDNHDFTTTFTAVAATVNNIGPGLGKAGPTESFSFFSGFSKYVMMFDMLAGRLELYPTLMLLAPDFWKGLLKR
ncbi:MAG: TrkH family potassium uptake protein [Oscillospiraceae bacterium]|nr:TrkH family potassium uptake protein [Oscillospiraceae bacterium]